ncbi:MAG: RNA polymerase sigma factor [Planctomycetota bacterium]
METAGVDRDLRGLFEREESRLLKYAFRLTGRRAVAEEIVQDVFLKLHAQQQAIDAPEAWLTRCVRNQAFEWWRRSKREVLQSDDQIQSHQRETDNAAETTLDQLEMRQSLRTIMSTLEEKDQQLIQLKYFAGLKYREISQQTGLSVSNVGYRLHHILKRLAAELKARGGECQYE